MPFPGSPVCRGRWTMISRSAISPPRRRSTRSNLKRSPVSWLGRTRSWNASSAFSSDVSTPPGRAAVVGRSRGRRPPLPAPSRCTPPEQHHPSYGRPAASRIRTCVASSRKRRSVRRGRLSGQEPDRRPEARRSTLTPSPSGSGWFFETHDPPRWLRREKLPAFVVLLLLVPANGRDGRRYPRRPSLAAYGIVGQFAGCGWSTRIAVLSIPGGRR